MLLEGNFSCVSVKLCPFGGKFNYSEPQFTQNASACQVKWINIKPGMDLWPIFIIELVLIVILRSILCSCGQVLFRIASDG